MRTYFEYNANPNDNGSTGARRGYSMRRAGNAEKLHCILMSVYVISFMILMICCAGCTSTLPFTPKATLPPTTIPVDVTTTIPTTTEPVNLSSSLTNGTTIVPTTNVTTVSNSPATTMTSNVTSTTTPGIETDPASGLTTVPTTTPVPPPDPSDPIIGTWAFANDEGMAVTLVFSADGKFSGTLDETPSPPGTWNQDRVYEYTVTLTTEESRNYRYDADTDTLYDVSYPDIFITRQ